MIYIFYFQVQVYSSLPPDRNGAGFRLTAFIELPFRIHFSRQSPGWTARISVSRSPLVCHCRTRPDIQSGRSTAALTTWSPRGDHSQVRLILPLSEGPAQMDIAVFWKTRCWPRLKETGVMNEPAALRGWEMVLKTIWRRGTEIRAVTGVPNENIFIDLWQSWKSESVTFLTLLFSRNVLFWWWLWEKKEKKNGGDRRGIIHGALLGLNKYN